MTNANSSNYQGKFAARVQDRTSMTSPEDREPAMPTPNEETRRSMMAGANLDLALTCLLGRQGAGKSSWVKPAMR